MDVKVLVAILSIGIASAEARSFGGYECADDCSGHAAGYRWAERRRVQDTADCPLVGRRTSFWEGCMAYTEDRYRGGDEDDDGDPVD